MNYMLYSMSQYVWDYKIEKLWNESEQIRNSQQNIHFSLLWSMFQKYLGKQCYIQDTKVVI